MVVEKMTIDALNTYVGGLSNPSKMPGYSFSIPAKDCITGGKLQKKEGTVCYDCYAMKGMYRFPGTVKAMKRRMSALKKKHFVEAMAELLNRRQKRHPEFRWHDSGDLQGVWHFDLIVAIARLTPNVQHWIPTREYRIVKDWLRENGGLAAIPSNLNVRMSAHMIGGFAPTGMGMPISTVSESPDDFPNAYQCPSRFQDNNCGDCRACWDTSIPHVNYHKH